MRTIIREAKKQDTIINFVSKERLDQMSETGRHQGVIAHTAAFTYAQVEDILEIAREKRGRSPLSFYWTNTRSSVTWERSYGQPTWREPMASSSRNAGRQV